MNDRHQWSCEHCGRDTRDAERPCDYCGSGMCERCTDAHDETGVCPSTAPVGVPAAQTRDEQLGLLGREESDMKPGDPIHVALWDAINAYAKSLGGTPSANVYGNTARMRAVVKVETAVSDYIAAFNDTNPRTITLRDVANAMVDGMLQEWPAGADSITLSPGDLRKLVVESAMGTHHLGRLAASRSASKLAELKAGAPLPDSKWSIERVSDRIVLHCSANGVTVGLRMGVDGARNLAATLLSRADMLELRCSPIHTVEYQESPPLLPERSARRGGASPDWDEHD